MSHEIILAIVGWREYKDYEEFCRRVAVWIAKYGKPDRIISGDEPNGTDAMAKRYAREYGYEFEILVAEWQKYGKKAGPARNKLVARRCTHMLAFPSHRGFGTQSAIGYARGFHRNVSIKWVDRIE